MKQKITLIVPAYNEEPFIDRCIASIKNQTVPFDQVIFIDDYSTDGTTKSLLAVNGKQDWTCCRFIKNQGVSAARNKGIREAKGDWITFLDADDELTPDACKKMHRAIERWGDQTDWIQFNHLRHYARVNKTVKKYWNEDGWIDIQNLHDKHCWWGVWNKLIRADAIEWLFLDPMRYGEDGIWVLTHLLNGARIWQVNQETVVHHFENPNSLTKSKTAEQLDLLEHKLRCMLRAHSDTTEPYDNIKAIIGCIDSIRENPNYKEVRK